MQTTRTYCETSTIRVKDGKPKPSVIVPKLHETSIVEGQPTTLAKAECILDQTNQPSPYQDSTSNMASTSTSHVSAGSKELDWSKLMDFDETNKFFKSRPAVKEALSRCVQATLCELFLLDEVRSKLGKVLLLNEVKALEEVEELVAAKAALEVVISNYFNKNLKETIYNAMDEAVNNEDKISVGLLVEEFVMKNKILLMEMICLKERNAYALQQQNRVEGVQPPPYSKVDTVFHTDGKQNVNEVGIGGMQEILPEPKPQPAVKPKAETDNAKEPQNSQSKADTTVGINEPDAAAELPLLTTATFHVIFEPKPHQDDSLLYCGVTIYLIAIIILIMLYLFI